MPFQLPEINLPSSNTNAASKVMSAMQSGITPEGTGGGEINAAAVSLYKEQNEEKERQRKEVVSAHEYAVQLLARVSSDEDLQIAKEQFRSRYPQFSNKIDETLPSYNPDAVKYLESTLKSQTTLLNEQQLAWDKEKTERGWMAEDEKITGYAPGTQLRRGEEVIGTVPTKPDYDIFEGEDGNQIYVPKGSKIPDGYKQVKGSGTSINIQTGMEKSTKTQLEKDIIEGVQNINSFKKTQGLFKADYLTYMGKTSKEVASLLDKVGMTTKKQKEFIQDRAKWFRRAKSDFIAYRKWATGVAGGKEELKEIATSFPDPVKNSPTEYMANLKSVEETTKEILRMNRDFLESGIDLDQPLDAIFEEIKGKELKIDNPPGGVSPSSKKGSSDKGNVVLKFDKEGNLIE